MLAVVILACMAGISTTESINIGVPIVINIIPRLKSKIRCISDLSLLVCQMVNMLGRAGITKRNENITMTPRSMEWTDDEWK
jgi:hypothetical protein